VLAETAGSGISPLGVSSWSCSGELIGFEHSYFLSFVQSVESSAALTAIQWMTRPKSH
jgi:hypothetical protein